MPKRRRIRRSKPVVQEEELEDEEDLDVEEPEEEDEPPPVRSRRRQPRKVVEPEPEEEDELEDEFDEEDVGEEEPEEESAPAPEEIKVQKVSTAIAENVFEQLFSEMREGEALLVVRNSKNEWGLSLANAHDVGVGQKLSGAEYWNEVLNPEFVQWTEEWKNKTFEEKVKYAKKLKVTWKQNEDQGVETISLTQAVRKAENIKKYKPEYESRTERAKIRA